MRDVTPEATLAVSGRGTWHRGGDPRGQHGDHKTGDAEPGSECNPSSDVDYQSAGSPKAVEESLEFVLDTCRMRWDFAERRRVRKKLKRGTGNDGRRKIIFCKSGGCTAARGRRARTYSGEAAERGKIRICWWAMTAKTMHPSTG